MKPARPISLLLLGLASLSHADESELIEHGKQLFIDKICATCHQVPGGPDALAGVAMKAPKFEGKFWGTEREVTLGYGGPDAKATFNEAYFIESIREPMKKVVKSAAAPMPPPPAVTDEEMTSLIAYMKSISAGGTDAVDGVVKKGALKNFSYAIYHGSWEKLPDFSKLDPIREGKTDSGIADTAIAKVRDNFGLVIEGDIEIAKEGNYAFKLGSDDGSRLFVNGTQLIDNDGIHGNQVREGKIDLKPGTAHIRLEYFEKGGGEELSLDMSGPGIKKLQLAKNTAKQAGNNKPKIATGHPIVAPEGEAVMYRNFIEGGSPRSIGVGYAEGVNVCFDANCLNYSMAWHGAFMDGARHWNGRGQGFQPPSGHYLINLPRTQAVAQLSSATEPWPEVSTQNNDDDRAKGLSFKGYRLGENMRPVFRYLTESGVTVEDAVTPKAGDLPSFIRTLHFKGNGNLYYLAAADAVIEPVGEGSWKVGKTLKLTLKADRDPILRDGAKGKELLIPVSVNGEAQVHAAYEWDLK